MFQNNFIIKYLRETVSVNTRNFQKQHEYFERKMLQEIEERENRVYEDRNSSVFFDVFIGSHLTFCENATLKPFTKSQKNSTF